MIPTATSEREENLDVETVSELVPRTFYTTLTYFTTLFKEGKITFTGHLETVTNIITDPFFEPTTATVQPMVTHFTTKTYWTTSVYGSHTAITSHEKTFTDIQTKTDMHRHASSAVY